MTANADEDVLLSAERAARQGAVSFLFRTPVVVEVRGPEAATFLHNLCTNDIKALAVGQWCEAFFCTHTARVIAHALVTRLAGAEPTFWVEIPPSDHLAPDDRIFGHLDRHLISEQVELTNLTGTLTLVRAVGPATATLSATRRHSLLGRPGVDFVLPASEVDATLRQLVASHCALAPPELHEVMRIEAAFPKAGAEFDDNRFVVEINRTQQAISYTKGCYLGQEPIVMARDRGQVQRLLVRVRGGTTPRPSGTRLLRDSVQLGVITSSVMVPGTGQALSLAYVKRAESHPGTRMTSENDSAALVTC